MKLYLATALFAFMSTACAGSSTHTLRNQSPASVLDAVDKRVYSPVRQGLSRVEADILVDVTGFYPAKSRPSAPVWLPVHFVWNQGQAAFTTKQWPAGTEALKKEVLAQLAGKEEDLIHTPFAMRFADYQLSLSNADGKVNVIAQIATDPAQIWQLTVNEALLVPAINARIGDRTISTEFTYSAATPSLIERIDTTYADGKQQTMVQIRFSYGKAGKFVLPDELVYRTVVDRAEFPPFTLRVRNVKVTE